MKTRHYILSILTALVFLSAAPHSQAQDPFARIEFGLVGGGMNYIGDLNNQSLFGKVNLGYSAYVRYNFNNRWALRVGGTYGHLEGGNPDYIERRNLCFSSPLYEGHALMEFNFMPYGLKGEEFNWTPYLFVGLGFFGFNPQAEFLNPLTEEMEWFDLQPLGTEGQGSSLYPDRLPYSRFQMMMPFGLGFKFKPCEMLTLGFEYGFRKTWTDYIDDCSLTYVGSELLEQMHGQVAAGLADRTSEVIPDYENAIGIKRGDDSLNDWYSFFNLYITFRFDKLFGWARSKRCHIYK